MKIKSFHGIPKASDEKMAEKMNIFRNLVVFILGLAGLLSGQVISWDTLYVNKNQSSGDHSGNGWVNACLSIDEAFIRSKGTNLVIKVAQGTYYPVVDTGKYMIKKSEVKIIGGYPLHPVIGSIPQPDSHPTIISGDIDTNDIYNPADSTYTIVGNNLRSVLSIQAGNGIDIYGLTIVCGKGGLIQDLTRSLPGGPHYLGGGGLYLETAGRCLISKCNFFSNISESTGGAIAFFGFNCEFFIDSSYFKSNISQSITDTSDSQEDTNCKIGGGAIYARSILSLKITNSKFNNCSTSNAGGAINFHSSAYLKIINSDFENNYAGSDGGAIYCLAACSLSSDATVSRFYSNHAGNGCGGAIFTRNSLGTIVRGFIFNENSSTDSGGAVCIYGNNTNLFSNCVFSNDSALKGGAAFLYVDDFQFDTVTFNDNRAVIDGGGVLSGSWTGIFNACTLQNNHAGHDGGAFYGGTFSDMNYVNTKLLDNTANGNGGAICFDKGHLICTDSTEFQGNTSNFGGAICFLSLPAEPFPYCDITNSVFRSNHANNSGGATYQDFSNVFSNIYSSLFLNNSADSTGAVFEGYNGEIVNSCLADNQAGRGCIIDAKRAAGNNELRLSSCTIANNTVASGQTVITNANTIKNSIIWNEAEPYNNCTNTPIYSILNKDLFASSNKNKDPKFMGSGQYPYSLTSASPAMDEADPGADTTQMFYDLAGKLRIKHGRMDIGAYEFASKRIYVNCYAMGNNNGYSWKNALKKLQNAIALAVPGDTIWVAKGTYFPSDSNNRNKSFSFDTTKSNIAILGGFYGNETSASQRDWRRNPTYLNGDIGTIGNSGDNSYIVLQLNHTRNVVVDGFSIEHGVGGIYGVNISNIVFRNCNILSNGPNGMDGAGCFLQYGNKIIFENCFFAYNSTQYISSNGALSIYNADSVFVKGCSFYCNYSNRSYYPGLSGAIHFSIGSFNIINSSFYSNTVNSIPAYTCAFDSCHASLENCIIWNPLSSTIKEILLQSSANLTITHCNLRNGLDCIDTVSGTVVSSDVWGNEPAFQDTSTGDLQLTRKSFCVDRGINVDTSGWGFDIDGNPRIHNGTIDLGAYEFQGVVLPDPPQLLSTLNLFEIPSNGQVTIALNKKNVDSSGYYVSYYFRDISELAWSATPPDTNVKISLAPGSNRLTVSVNSSYHPGSFFNIRLRAGDPEFYQITSEKTVRFNVVSPQFEVCSLTVSQYVNGKNFIGAVRAKRTNDPIYLSNGRIYLGDSTSTTTNNMQYIKDITLTETIPPASRGGSVECGEYEFSFNATSAVVYNPNGISTGKTLYQWAADSLSRYPGSLYYKSKHALKLFFPVTNGIDKTILITKIVPADFDAPLTQITVRRVDAHKQVLLWSYNKPLVGLTLFIIPEGTNAPKVDTIVFDSLHLTSISFTADSLQDSRKYLYVLRALDQSGNIGISQTRDSTPSGLYSISGVVAKFHVDTTAVIPVHVFLYNINPDNSRKLLRDSLIALDSGFTFGNIQNGSYAISVGRVDKYYSAPIEIDTLVMRDTIRGLHFDFMPGAVLDQNAVRVEQIDGTGDLKFTAETNNLFYGEKPVRVVLNWEIADSITAKSDSQAFEILPGGYLETAHVDGSATWQFTITREMITDSILSRKSGFEEDVRYVNSRLETKAFGYPIFRSGLWSYPENDSNGIRILFAPQRFKKPVRPMVSNPIVSTDDASFLIHNSEYGPEMQAAIKFEQINGLNIIEKTFDFKNLSTVITDIVDSSRKFIIRPLNWKYTDSYKADSQGRTFLSGLLLDSIIYDSVNLKNDTTFSYGTGFVVPGKKWIPGTISDTIPYASWGITIPDTGDYWTWIYVDRAAVKERKVFITFGSVDTGKKYQFKIPKERKGWQPIDLSSKLVDSIYTTIPHLLKGIVNVNLFFPDTDISVSSIALTKRKRIGENAPTVSPSLRNRVSPLGNMVSKADASGFHLNPDTPYKLSVWVHDRYGNVSDSAIFDTIQTRDNYFNNNIVIHEKPVTGNLMVTLNDTAADFIDSLICRFDGHDYPLLLHYPLNKYGPTEIEISRNDLADLLPITAFKRHTVYDSLFAVLAYDTIYTVSTNYTSACGDCEDCYSRCTEDPVHRSCNCKQKTKWRIVVKWYGIWPMKVTTHDCQFAQLDTMIDTIRTPRIPAKWPNGADYQVASQEYREILTPVLDSVETTSRFIKLSCSNLNGSDSARREQMAGNLYVKWKPGSTCADSTIDTIPFGNRFTMDGNWVSFIPSFDGAISTNTGVWRTHDTLGTHHQWIDRFDSLNSLLGGEFFPNIGDSVTKYEAANNSSLVPSISTGIYLTQSQASSDSISPAQKFNLWVMPSRMNTASSCRFFWGLDGKPDTSYVQSLGSVSALSWATGHSIYIPKGNHTVDLFMRDDGIGIAAIALSKDTTPPPMPQESLSRWGNAGFTLDVTAKDLPSKSKIDFTWKAVDRFGNVSEPCMQSRWTKDFDSPIPGVVVTPDMALENGIYHSIYPSFTLSLDHSDSTNLTLETQLRWNHGGSSDSISLLNVSLTDTVAHIWSASVDSSLPLMEFPDSGGVSVSNGYAIRARVITSDGKPGDWTQLLFGIMPDSSELPPVVTVRDSIYEIPALKFRFDHGVQTSANTISGDLEVLFDFENSGGKRLMLEGAQIITASHDSASVLINDSITGISGGTLAAYDCDDYSSNCSRVAIFSFPYGKFTIDAVAESLSIATYGSIKKIRAPLITIHDDNNNAARLSSNLNNPVAVPFSRCGITDSCFVTEDRFFLENVLTYGTVRQGFSVDACRLMFARDTAAGSYSIFAAGCNNTLGPDLKFTVTSPKYLDEEFTLIDGLRDPVFITYTDSLPQYQLHFPIGNNAVLSSRNGAVHYLGWDIGINSYTFGPDGVTLTDFNVGINSETFPEEKNSGLSSIEHFSGTKIEGHTAVNDGALHLFGDAKVSGTGVTLTTSNDYVFKNIDTLKYSQAVNYEYQLRIPAACSLSTPAYKNKDFNEKDPVVIRVHPDSGLVLAPDGIVKVNASGSFDRSISKLTIKGNLSVTYAAHDFQLKIAPNGTDSLFRIQGFFKDCAQVNIAKASIGLFSDFTINTLYGKKEGKYTAVPEEFDFAGIPSSGFDLFKTSGESTAGIRVLLLAPEFDLSSLNSLMNLGRDSSCSFKSSIYNAGFDLNNNMTNLSGRIDMPENIMSCFGAHGISKFSEDIASFKLKTIYLGYDADSGNGGMFTVGADASITFGEKFNPIGLKGEIISLSKLTAGYSKDAGWSLQELHASAFPLPRLIGIGPGNFKGNDGTSADVDSDKRMQDDSANAVNYVELYTGGKGFNLDYTRDNLTLDLRNWSLRLTDKFPVEQLRGISFLLDTLTYVKNDSYTGIKALSCAGQYIPPKGILAIGKDLAFYNTRIRLGYDKPGEDIKQNRTKLNAYFSIAFDSMMVGNKVLQMSSNGDPDCKTGLKIYFDGNVSGSACIVWKDTVGIVPWGEEHNPKIFVDPCISSGGPGIIGKVAFDTRKGFNLALENVMIRSKDKIPGLDTTLAVNVAVLDIGFVDKKFCLNKLDVSWYIYKKIFENEAFKLVVNKIDLGYQNGKRTQWESDDSSTTVPLSDKFWIITEPEFKFKLSKDCTVDAAPTLGLIVTPSASDTEQAKAAFIWKVRGDFKCSIGNFDLGAKFKINSDTIGFDTAFLDMNNLQKYGVLHNDSGGTGMDSLKVGVAFKNVYWIKDTSSSSKKWNFNAKKGDKGNEFKVIPTFSFKQSFDINVLAISGRFNFERLFTSPYPGIGYEDIRVKLTKLGNIEVPLCMSLYLDGKKPFLHPEFDKPSKFSISLGGIELTKDITLGEALMEVGTEKAEGTDYETWYFRGMASMNLKPAVDNVSVDVAFEKPQPWENITGIRHAKIKLKLATSCRIPLGTTPFFIAGFEGALYDGTGMPEGATKCYIPTLPPGLKTEAAVLIEFEEPSVVNGKLGFWMHLYKLNFGFNGEVVAFEGIADAQTCAALYNNGTAFHGHFLANVHLGLEAKGRFTIDLWKDKGGANFTADALAAIGLGRGSLINCKFIKVPTKTKWFLELFTKAGKFEHNINGLTTGLRFFGKNWGLGILGGKFKMGDLGQYKLKQSPVVVPDGSKSMAKRISLSKTLAMDASVFDTSTQITVPTIFMDPGIILEGDEVISMVAATDTTPYVWPENVLRVADSDREFDPDTSDYIPLEGRGNDTVKTYFLNEDNTVARLWVNNKKYKSILIAVPDSIRSSSAHGGFEYLISAGLKPASFDEMSARPEDSTGTLKVHFNGTISNFQGNIRTIVRTKPEDSTLDTLLRQRMALKFYASSIDSRPVDTALTENYLYNFLEIPLSQLEGYNDGDTSLLQFDPAHVFYDSSARVLHITDLVWNTATAAPGKFAMRAAVEITDFVVEDGSGSKTILPENRVDEASVYRDDPIVISHPALNDTVVINIVCKDSVTKPTGFTATGSAADTNWNGESEGKSIFLRWNQDDNPAVDGYQITWYPSRDSAQDDPASVSRRRSTVVGKIDHYTINIPDFTSIDSLYTDNCDSAEGEVQVYYKNDITYTSYLVPCDSGVCNSVQEVKNDTGKIIDTINLKYVYDYDTTRTVDSTRIIRPNRLCPKYVDTSFYKANEFNVIITPVVNGLVKITDTSWAPGRPDTMIKVDPKITFADTIKNVHLHWNNGDVKNNFKVAFKPDNQYLDSMGHYNGLPIDVPLNTGTVVKVAVAVTDTSTGVNASRYGELWAKTMNSSVAANAMPRGGAFHNYFTVTGDTFLTSVSFKPMEKSMTCREMFSSTSRKMRLDSLSNPIKFINDSGRVDSVYESITEGCKPTGMECSDCDPNANNNKLSLNDPCNGHPDSVIYNRTPFDNYTMYLYAVNNGRRGKPVVSASGGPVVYDSITFHVVPPKPVLHGVSPSYVLSGRPDTLSLAVSKIWLDSSAQDPAVRIRWTTKSGTDTSRFIPLDSSWIKPMVTSQDDRNWKLETSADWQVLLPTQSIYIVTTGEVKFSVSVVNRDHDVNGVSVQSESNDFQVAYVYSPDSIECPSAYYDPDSSNAEYLMDFVGNYPSDMLSPGDSLFVRFTELHDFNKSNYTIRLVRDHEGVTELVCPIDTFKIDYEGIKLRLPNTIQITNVKEYRVITNLNTGMVSQCTGKNWGQHSPFSTVPRRSYDLQKVGNGFRIVVNPAGRKYRYLDEVYYSIGSNSFTDVNTTTSYDSTSEPVIPLYQSDWVTATISRKSGGVDTTIRKWIDVEVTPELVYPDNTPVPDSFMVEPGDIVYIRSPRLSFYDGTGTVPFHTYKLSSGDSADHRDEIVFSEDSRGPLTIERWAETKSGQSFGYHKSREGSRTYQFTVRKFNKNEIAGIIMPSQRILDATQRKVDNYPVLLRLDTTIVPRLDSLLSSPFHFRDATLKPIPFEVENIDNVNHKANIWVRLSNIDPSIGNNTVYLTAGSRDNDSQSVWSNYRAVWHFNSGSIIHDATGNGFDIQAISGNLIPGLINTSYACSTSCSPLSVPRSPRPNVSPSSILTSSSPGLTLSGWIKLSSIPSSPASIVTFEKRSGASACSFLVTPDSGLVFTIGKDSLKTPSGAIEENTWLHVAVTYNWVASSGAAIIYVNGLPVALKERMNSAIGIENTDSMFIAGGNFNGKIDELRLATEVLSSSQIALDYYSQRNRTDFLKVPSGVTSITEVSNPGCRLVPGSKPGDYLSVGIEEWTINTLPVDLRGKTWLLMPWNDRYSVDDSLVTIKLNGPATVNVLIHSRCSTVPQFLDGYTNSGRSVLVEGPGDKADSLIMYTKNFDSAATITFGGPRSGGAVGGNLPWAVLLDCVKDEGRIRAAAGPYPYVRTEKASNGSLLFSDRENEIDSLPSQFNDAVLVRMPNAYRFSDSSSLLTLSVNRPAVVNLLLDTLYTSWPSFVVNDSTWMPRGIRIKSANRTFNVFQKSLSGNESFVLGGPRVGGGKGNRSFYALLVQPDNDTALVTVMNPPKAEIAVVDTGVLPYMDSLWHISALPAVFKNMVLIRTHQSDYANTDSVNIRIKLRRSSWIYCAVDVNQTKSPSFIRQYDANGGWQRTTLNIETSTHGVYSVFRKFHLNGLYKFSGARHGGSNDNQFNYFMFAGQKLVDTIINGVDSNRIIITDTGKTPYDSLRNKIIYLPPEILGSLLIKGPAYSEYCDTMSFRVTRPVRVWLGVDPAFQTTATYLHSGSWQQTRDVISLSGGLKDRIVWNKTFDPGLIEIPGVQCAYPQPGVMNPIIIVEFLNAPSQGLTVRNLKATGFGDERRAETESYIVKNLDVAYSWEMGMRSRSWIVNVEAHSAMAEPGDTMSVLTPFGNDTIFRTNDTVVVREGHEFMLPDLLPGLVAADSVTVNAIDLSARGSVRIGINNRSDVSINNFFNIILFEDKNGDFKYSRNIDKSLGSAVVNGIGPNQIKLYSIELNDTLSFPHRAILAFVDANQMIYESDEWNNVKSSGTTCEEFERGMFVEDSASAQSHDSLSARVPASADTVIYCYLTDNNGDSLVDVDDSLYALFVYNYKLYAINSRGDSLFAPVQLNGLASMKLLLDDFTGDGLPEIIAGSVMYSNTGSKIWDASQFVPSSNPALVRSYDFNVDGDRDSVVYNDSDSCVVITSGLDSSVLYVNPFSRWTGRTDDVTTGVLADVVSGEFHCYDLNASFPRYSITLSDTVDLTVRVANAGAYPVKKIGVEVFADSSNDSTSARLNQCTKIGEAIVSRELNSQDYYDVKFTTVLPAGTKRLWFVTDSKNRYFECEERDNIIGLRVNCLTPDPSP